MKPEAEWRWAQKRPVVVGFRKPQGTTKMLGPPYEIVEGEWVETLNGKVLAVKSKDYVIRGINGELYPCDVKIFNQTYDLLPDWMQKWRLNEPKWQSDLVGIIWAYARSEHLTILDSAHGETDAAHERLPPGLGDLIRNIRMRCHRCGVTPYQAQQKENFISCMNPITRYQCCRIDNGLEVYHPNLCPECHQERERQFPHPVVSV